MVPGYVLAHLRQEIAAPDPWHLAESPFERRRYEMLWSMFERGGPFGRVLEIGCAAGVFTERLAARVPSLGVVDLLPEAIARCRARLGGRAGLHYAVADVSAGLPFAGVFDCAIVSEVLYYAGSRSALSRAVDEVSAAVRPGGTVILGSATDAVVRRWRLICGAETAIEEFSRRLTLIDECSCMGSAPDEHAELARFAKR